MKIVNFHIKKMEQIEAEMIEMNEHMIKAKGYLVRLKARISNISDDLRALYDEKEELENEYVAQLVTNKYGELDCEN